MPAFCLARGLILHERTICHAMPFRRYEMRQAWDWGSLQGAAGMPGLVRGGEPPASFRLAHEGFGTFLLAARLPFVAPRSSRMQAGVPHFREPHSMGMPHGPRRGVDG